MNNGARSWLDVPYDSLDSCDDTTSDALRTAIEPLPSWDRASCSGNNRTNTFHTSAPLSKRTGSLEIVEPARVGMHASRGRFVDPLENDIPPDRRGWANSGPRRKCVYYEEEERFWRERSESCRVQQNAAAASVYDFPASDNDLGNRTRPRSKSRPGAPKDSVGVSPHEAQSSAFFIHSPIQNSEGSSDRAKRTALMTSNRRTPLFGDSTAETKEPRRSFDLNGGAERSRKARERRRISGDGWSDEPRDAGCREPNRTGRRCQRRPMSAGQVSDGVRGRQRSEEGLCMSTCRCRRRRLKTESGRRLCALRDVERALNAILVGTEGGGGLGNGGNFSDFYVGAVGPPNIKEAKRYNEETATVVAADDVNVFGSSGSPRRRPRFQERRRGEFFGDKEKGGDRAGSEEGRGGYRQQKASASATAAPVGRDGFYLSTLEKSGMNRGDDKEGEEGCDYDDQAEEATLSRVGDLGRRIALRCLHMEQECMRRERTQARLFQEQLRGARLVAQELTQRAIRAERSLGEKVLAKARNKFEGREKALVEQSEKAEEKWKKERDVLNADAAAATTELNKTKRLSRESAESLKRDCEEALQKQRRELQRSWAAEKGGWRKTTEDAIRRAVEAKTRTGEEAARQAQELRHSLEAQVRSWKGKAEASEKRVSEERNKRRALETGENSEHAKEMEKARQAHETVLRDMTSTVENNRKAHALEKEQLQEEHRAHLLRVHQGKKGILEAERLKWQQEMQEIRAQANTSVEEALTRATQERTEALRRLRLAHDVEMRKAGRDILSLEREIRRLKAKKEDEGSSSLNASTDIYARNGAARQWRSPQNLGDVFDNAGYPGGDRYLDGEMAKDNSSTRAGDPSRGVRLVEADAQQGDNVGGSKPNSVA